MSHYRVEIAGTTVWEGDGDDIKTIPAQYRDRPIGGAPAHHLFETTDDGDECLIGVQTSMTTEG